MLGAEILFFQKNSISINHTMLIGRKKEIQVLQKLLASPKAEMVAVIGRRRVGKTHLIQTIYEDNIIFEQTGVRNATNEDQLRTFTEAVQRLSKKEIKKPKDWLDAFFRLRDVLEEVLDKNKKYVLFFDELSWLADKEHKFLDFLGHFWNSWASRQNLIVVLCGSASSWIIKNVINDVGGLHNRVTKYLHLKPFTLLETKTYLETRYLSFTPYQMVQMYMAFGGIPLYLEQIESGKSAIQNINDICFTETGFLKNEFNRLYIALFENAQQHIGIVRALAKKHRGLSRQEIIHFTGLPDNEDTASVLKELERSDFIMAYFPYGKKEEEKIFRLIDEYSLFYLRFIENAYYQGEGTFLQLSQRQEFKIWSGYAYENVWMKHVEQIKKILGITSIYSTTFSYLKPASKDEKGLQIDLLLERVDHVINLFEIKFYTEEFVFTKSFREQLQKRIELFKRLSGTRHQVVMTLITTFGSKPNKYSLGLVDSVLTLEDLFVA